MDYSDVELDMRWGQNRFSLLKYVPWYPNSTNKQTYLILDFKEGKLIAQEKVKDLAIEAFRIAEDDLLEMNCRYLVTIPSHSEDQANEPCEYICSALAKTFPWLIHLKAALRRSSTVQKSATAPPGERPDYSMHVSTIQYAGPPLVIPDSTIIMIDDVVTRGDTSGACGDILRVRTNCKDVLGFFIGRTTRL